MERTIRISLRTQWCPFFRLKGQGLGVGFRPVRVCHLWSSATVAAGRLGVGWDYPDLLRKYGRQMATGAVVWTCPGKWFQLIIQHLKVISGRSTSSRTNKRSCRRQQFNKGWPILKEVVQALSSINKTKQLRCMNSRRSWCWNEQLADKNKIVNQDWNCLVVANTVQEIRRSGTKSSVIHLEFITISSSLN